MNDWRIYLSSFVLFFLQKIIKGLLKLLIVQKIRHTNDCFFFLKKKKPKKVWKNIAGTVSPVQGRQC
jgi:hypothetical protein